VGRKAPHSLKYITLCGRQWIATCRWLTQRDHVRPRSRQRLVEEGFEGMLARNHSPNSARRRTFDGVAVRAPAEAGG
jgi:hypothetical protein